MTDDKLVITCPKCNEKIDFQEHLSREYQNQMEAEIRQQIVQEHSNKFEDAQAKWSAKEKEMREKIETADADKLRIQEMELEMENQDRKWELEKQKVEIEAKAAAQAEYQNMADVAAEQKSATHLIKIKELEDRMRQQRELHAEALRKAEQGSVQAQGEGGEIFIKDILSAAFPTDKISDVPKGAKGADILQSVVTVTGLEAGIIVWEGKRTKSWSKKWVSKVKSDTARVKGHISVIVSDVFPSGSNRMCMLEENVWICRFDEVETLATALRAALSRAAHIVVREEGKGDKMTLLYEYMTSEDFSSLMRIIYDSYISDKETIATEQRSMTRNWNKRLQAADARLDAMSGMMGKLSTIAHEIPAMKEIEKTDAKALPAPEEGDDDDEEPTGEIASIQ